ncbi:hypothetical protein AN958_11826 [Leucoagaricus sp. SymC.cos]|nr:hypothetical protein AN958_11826 [Leucoagaricus sp. SymC.cos]
MKRVVMKWLDRLRDIATPQRANKPSVSFYSVAPQPHSPRVKGETSRVRVVDIVGTEQSACLGVIGVVVDKFEKLGVSG